MAVRSILNVHRRPGICSTDVAPFFSSSHLPPLSPSSESRALSLLLALLLLLACVLLMLDWLLLSPEGGLSHPFGRHWDMAEGHYTPLSPSAPQWCAVSRSLSPSPITKVSRLLCPTVSTTPHPGETVTLVTSHNNGREGSTRWKVRISFPAAWREPSERYTYAVQKSVNNYLAGAIWLCKWTVFVLFFLAQTHYCKYHAGT